MGDTTNDPAPEVDFTAPMSVLVVSVLNTTAYP
jgi:hypothetical protein